MSERNEWLWEKKVEAGIWCDSIAYISTLITQQNMSRVKKLLVGGAEVGAAYMCFMHINCFFLYWIIFFCENYIHNITF